MYPTAFPRTKRSLFLGFEILLLLAMCLQVGVVPTAFASGGGPITSSATVSLQHSPAGTTYLSLDTATKTLTVKMDLVGLAPNSTHPTHIHLDSCNSSEPEKIQYKLTAVTADANGQGTSTTVLNGIIAIPATGWYIKVHNGPDLATEAEHAAIACAPITNPGGAVNVSASFGPANSLNENATGTAMLTVNNNVLTVSLSVSGLAPNSAHAAHIHAGNCTNSGKVLYNLTPLIADENGYATKTITFAGVSSIPASAWDINIHYSTDLSNQTGYNPILCGNVVPN